ncbi:MAG: hypothetical protein NTX28_08520, partial [Novosphingobium sp.]|nr:hypothetical protein [Novosphingobium sp.]
MKPERAFVAERAIAQHDAVLLRPAPDTAELVPVLARASERLAKALRGALAPLLGGIEPQIEPAAPTRSEYSEFTCWIPALAANSLMQIGSAPFLLTVAGESVLRLVDRAFGGSGEAPASMPKEFPLSAELMIGRIEKIVAASLSTALSGSVGAGAGGPAARPDVRAVRRDANVGQLQAMPGTTPVAELTLKVQEQGRKPWNITLAFPMDTLTLPLAWEALSDPTAVNVGNPHVIFFVP